MQCVTPPSTELELWQRAQAIAGKNLGELVKFSNQSIPKSLTQAKGFVGQLIERHLGANSGNKPEPDFQKLGIELKTIPLNANGSPKESTYICTAPFSNGLGLETWLTSRVRKKLSRVLWFPIEADPTINLSERRLGSPILWSPNAETEQILQEDWEELTSMIQFGEIENLSARLGTYLQIRPKAAHSRILSKTVDHHGVEVLLNPKGFYLRVNLTQKILQENYCVS